MTIMELTGQESGIIVYGNSTVAVVNWGSLGENQIPMFGPLNMMLGWPEDEGVFDGAMKSHVNDVRDALPGKIWLTEETDESGVRIADTDMEILSDEFGDLLRIFLGCKGDRVLDDYDPETETTEATVYTLTDGREIIAPEGWC